MCTITISKELQNELWRRATGFNDTPESVIWRELNKNKEGTMPESTGEAENTIGHGTDSKTVRPRRKKIGLKEIEQVYIQARLVFDAFEKGRDKGRKVLENALDHLEHKVGMNRGSARIYIKVFLTLKKGKLHKNKMSVNDVAAEYFLKNILADDGKKGLKMALESLGKYIEYREELVGGKMIVFGELHKEYSAKLD